MYKDDYAVITGSATLEPNSTENVNLKPMKVHKTDITVNYPTGFNAENSVVLGVEFKRSSSKAFATGWNNYPDSADSVRATLPYSLSLGVSSESTSMTLSVGSLSSSSVNIIYRIVLMKIS